MRLPTWIDRTFLVEVALLVLAAPLLYFPNRFPAWAPYAGLALLAAGWIWRRRRLGIWWQRTPADWPLVLLFCVMLPVSIWAAPGPLREQYSIPRTYIMLWNIALFAAIVAHGSRSYPMARFALAGFLASGTLIALVAPLGVDWQYKLPLIKDLVREIPGPLQGLFAGAEEGFHPNQVAGTLLYVFPLALALTVSHLLTWWQWRRHDDPSPSTAWWVMATATAFCTVVMAATLLLSQSRTALIGLAIGIEVMVLVNWRWGRWLLLVGGITFLVWLPLFPPSLVARISAAPPGTVSDVIGYTDTLAFRPQVWMQAVTALHDFPFTGMGFGTFREIAFLLYPIDVVPTYNLGHAHNFFLQTGLDFGLPGLIAILSVYAIAVFQIAMVWNNWRCTRDTVDGDETGGSYADGSAGDMPAWRADLRPWSVGFLGCLVAQTIYSQLDAVAMGAKTSFVFWYLFALIFSVANGITYSHNWNLRK